MDLQYSRHALLRMGQRGISTADVEAAIEGAERVTAEDTIILYDALVGGRRIRVVLARGSRPPRVVTVMRRRA